jgi:ABC-type transport system involved in multi-copper enzyme maturation permease subunit
VFQYASESLANSGSLREEHFYKAAEKYWKVYEAYVKEKVGEIIWYTWPGVTITRDDGKKIEVPGVSPKEYHGDISDFPEFVVPEIPIKESIKYSGWNITILILWNIALFLLAHVAFLKYDIR